MSAAKQQPLPASNAETLEAWDGPLFERFVKYRHIVVAGLQCHGEEAVRLHPPEIGDRTLDIGCGFGETTRRLTALTGPEGLSVGVDASPRFIAPARRETQGATATPSPRGRRSAASHSWSAGTCAAVSTRTS
jgi:SAM-dependent methyltransferase